MAVDVISERFEASQQAVSARIGEILDAVTVKDFDRLVSYHLDGPKFTKFDDVEPLGRQDAETAMRTEGIAEQFRRHPVMRAEVDDGYRGLANGFPDQISASPKKPKTRALKMSPKAWPQNLTRSPRLAIQSLGTANQPVIALFWATP